jgi:hypothetical protein
MGASPLRLGRELINAPGGQLARVRFAPDSRRIIASQRNDVTGHVWTAPAVQEESDVSAKRSGAAMYPACFRLKDFLHRDAAALAAGPDVIR